MEQLKGTPIFTGFQSPRSALPETRVPEGSSHATLMVPAASGWSSVVRQWSPMTPSGREWIVFGH